MEDSTISIYNSLFHTVIKTMINLYIHPFSIQMKTVLYNYLYKSLLYKSLIPHSIPISAWVTRSRRNRGRNCPRRSVNEAWMWVCVFCSNPQMVGSWSPDAHPTCAPFPGCGCLLGATWVSVWWGGEVGGRMERGGWFLFNRIRIFRLCLLSHTFIIDFISLPSIDYPNFPRYILIRFIYSVYSTPFFFINTQRKGRI